MQQLWQVLEDEPPIAENDFVDNDTTTDAKKNGANVCLLMVLCALRFPGAL